MSPPELETPRLVLRPVVKEHLSFIGEYLGDAEIRHNMKMPVLNTPEKLNHWWDKFDKWRQLGKVVQWSAFLKDSGEYVALITIKEIDRSKQVGELGYSVIRRFWREGFAYEAASKVLDYAFEHLKLERLVAQILPENAASQAVVAKLGFKRDSGIGEILYYQDQPFYLLQFSLEKPRKMPFD